MPQRIISNSFVSGEISPELYGRHDLKAYFNGAALLENFIVRRTGGIRKRAGTDVLYTLDSSISPDADTLDNRFKVFTYFYDSDTFGLLIFRIAASTGLIQRKLIIRENGTSSVGAWANIGIQTGIATTAQLDDLKCKQVGDTLFFTRLGWRSFTCRITMAERTAEFRLMDNSVDVPTPGAITATAQGFYKAANVKDDNSASGIYGLAKHYALYGVKDGILSKPSKVSTIAQTSQSTNGTTTPWTSGATVTISGTLDFSLYDYYILAKKAGINYGKISEIYPEETLSFAPATLASWNGEYRGTDGVGFATGGGGFLNANPYFHSSQKRTISMSQSCIGLKATEQAASYRFVTPHWNVEFNGGSAILNVVARADVVNCYSFAVVKAIYTGPATIYPFYYNDDGTGSITVESGISATFNASGNAAVSIGVRAKGPRMGFIIDIPKYSQGAAAVSDTMFFGAFLCSDAADGSYLSAADALLQAPSAFSSSPHYASTASSTTVFGKIGTTYVTTLWNLKTPIGIYADSAAQWNAAYLYAKASMTIASANNFNATATRLGYIQWTTTDAMKQITELSIYVGADTVNWSDGSKAVETQQNVTARLYAVEGPISKLVGEYEIGAGIVDRLRIPITYPDGVSPKTTYTLSFSSPIWARGIKATSLNSTLSFVDDNIIPGAVTGQQEMLVVGDVNMDCDVFDVYEQRSVYAGSKNLPFTLWFSAVGDLYNFYAFRPQGDDDAFSVTIPAKKASQIRHLYSGKELMLFTEDGVYAADAESGAGFSYRTIRLRKICNAAASASVAPVQIDGKTLFVGEDGRTVYELKYDLMQDAIMPTDRSVLAYHLTETAQIVKIAYQRFPDSVVWFLLDDGSLISMTYMPEHEVFAWSHHAFASNASNQKIVDIIEVGSLVTGDGVETTSDILLVTESYTDLGARDTKTTVERLRPNVCADVLEYGAPNNQCMDHFGGTYPVGVTAKLITLRPESPEVNTQGVPKRVVDVCLRIRRSGTVSVKPFEPSLSAVSTDPSIDDPEEETLTLFSGDLKLMPRGYVNGDGQLQIESTDSRPCEILSAVYTMDIP